jgi:nitroimidazol reductase NimA-like FMN-containing flavoprotein (pyridoxamine 5'-phosphate oxidase superfamily)
MSNRMTQEQREQYLSAVRIGVLSVGRPGREPLTIPVWYDYKDGAVVFTSADGSKKNDLLREAGLASLCVHNESWPYSYVTVEGPVTLRERSAQDVEDMAIRYLGLKHGREYASSIGWGGVLAELTPERWLTVDYSNAD